jgi:Apea-like HEPN
MSNELKFELLALDTLEKSVVCKEVNLLHAFLANGSLWNNAILDLPKFRIKDGNVTLEVQRVKGDAEADTELSRAFLVTVKAESSWLEPRRKPILELLKDRKFDYLYILLDQVSEEIANVLYPLIYKVENSLRAYLVRFMTIRIGPKWWEITATNDLTYKVQQRKNNEKEFSQFIDNNAYLIDFGDLGKLIYAHSSGFNKKEDIIRKVSDLNEDSETLKDAVQRLKKELDSNYQKFFSESFKQKDFQKKWEELEKIRHKVAHNNLFTNADLKQGKQLSEELIEIIDIAVQKVDEVALHSEEKEAILESLASTVVLNDITESELLKELKQREEYYSARGGGFVSLSNFVRVHLVAKGYDTSLTYQLIEDLRDQKKIESYYVNNPYNNSSQTLAIKLAQVVEN